MKTAFMRFLAAARRVPRSTRLYGGATLLLLGTVYGPSMEVTHNTFDYVIVLDITQSMNAADYTLDGAPVSRLHYAKQALRRALRELPCGSRIGLGVFSEYRALLLLAPVEVCSNLPDLIATLDRIDGRMAWAGASEIAKGLHSALRTARALPGDHGIVLMTDGHEAPPIHPLHRPQYDGKPGAVRGLIVGVGGAQLVPIPKLDAEGRSLGYWGADEVAQLDVYSRGRAAAGGEAMVDEHGIPETPQAPSLTEHLSSLKHTYLQSLARDVGLDYHTLTAPERLTAALTAPALGRPAPTRIDLRPLLAVCALMLLSAVYMPRLRLRHAHSRLGWVRRRNLTEVEHQRHAIDG